MHCGFFLSIYDVCKPVAGDLVLRELIVKKRKERRDKFSRDDAFLLPLFVSSPVLDPCDSPGLEASVQVKPGANVKNASECLKI